MRQSKTIEFLGNGILLERVTEVFTHRCDDGDVVMRGDPKKFHWATFSPKGNSSWFGVCPSNWEDKKAVEEEWSREYEIEADYS